MSDSQYTVRKLMDCLPQRGTVVWIGLRRERRGAVEAVHSAYAEAGRGLAGDHYKSSRSAKRQITLIQAEHLPVIAACLGMASMEPHWLRRNVVVGGINLLALKDKRFHIGGAVLETTGLCHPCSRMEYTLGPGGYNAVRGHGGITARILVSGHIHLGDAVAVDTATAGSENETEPGKGEGV